MWGSSVAQSRRYTSDCERTDALLRQLLVVFSLCTSHMLHPQVHFAPSGLAMSKEATVFKGFTIRPAIGKVLSSSAKGKAAPPKKPPPHADR